MKSFILFGIAILAVVLGSVTWRNEVTLTAVSAAKVETLIGGKYFRWSYPAPWPEKGLASGVIEQKGGELIIEFNVDSPKGEVTLPLPVRRRESGEVAVMIHKGRRPLREGDIPHSVEVLADLIKAGKFEGLLPREGWEPKASRWYFRALDISRDGTLEKIVLQW